MDQIGIIGAGKLGTTIARLVAAGGGHPLVARRDDPVSLGLLLQAIVPGARAASIDEVMHDSEIVILAVPLHAIETLPTPGDRLIIDATNYWEAADGARPAFLEHAGSHSEAVAAILGSTRVVKSLNHLGYHDLDLLAAPSGSAGRVAVGVAGDDADDRAMVSRLVDLLGFDPVELPTLHAGRMLESGHAAFGAPLTATGLALAVAQLVS